MKRMLEVVLSQDKTDHRVSMHTGLSLRVACVIVLAVMTACAPQAPLPTQAVLPTQNPESAVVSTQAPDVTTDASVEGQSTTAEEITGLLDPQLSGPEAVVENPPAEVIPSDTVISKPASVAVEVPTVRLLGVPRITVAEPAVPNVIVIQVDDAHQALIQNQVEALGGTITYDPALEELGAVLVTVPENVNPSDVARLGQVAQTEPDYYAVALTDDPLLSQQWGRSLLRVSNATLPDNAPVINVAVIDSGVCYDHPDLAGRFLTGWDYVGNDADPRDEFGHGCEVSGIIAAVEGNGIGIAGMSAQIRILPYRVLDGRGIGRYSNVAAAIVRAVQDGAQVINLSLGGPNTSDLLTEAVAYARQAGVVVVAAAGNSGLPQVYYPAALEGVISVGSIGENRLRSTFSNYGKIELWAPGENILTTLMDGTYGRANGTSFAAPHVAGLAALELAAGRYLVTDGLIAAYGGGGEPLAVAPTPLPADDKALVTNTRPAMKNPAALICTNLGYEYVITHDAEGNEDADCLMPDDATECPQWDFYAGTCGQAFNFCAQQGYQTVSLSDGQDPYSESYAVCTDANGQQIGSVTDLSALEAQASGCEDGSCRMSFPDLPYSVEGRTDPQEDPISALSVPTSWDWRSYNGKNWVTSVKNQGGCGSCGVFSAVGAIEAALKISAGDPDSQPDLAEQYMISTCYQSPNSICSSGSHSDWTLTVAKNTGLCDEDCMPYVARSTDCGARCADWSSRLTKISDFGFATSGLTANYIKQLIVNRGPVAAYIRISNGSYSNGYLTCSQDTPIDHAIVLVGYNDAGGYWIMKNSWGTNWGENGYARVRYGDCGIDSQYIAFASAVPNLPASTDVIRNGTFQNGTAEWAATGEVDWETFENALYFKRRNPSPTGFSISQVLNYRIPQNTPMEVMVDLGNTSAVSKTISFTLRNRNTEDGAQTCTVTVPPHSPLRTYSMELVSGEWVNGVFEVGLLEADGLANVVMTNVRVSQKSGVSGFKCRYPQADPDIELLHNYSFDLGKEGWETPADVTWSVASGEASLISKPAQTRGFYQNTARRLNGNSPMELTFTVKNTSATQKNITVTLIDETNLNWSAPYLITCPFDLLPNQSEFMIYTVRGRLPADTNNLRLHIDFNGPDTSLGVVFSSLVLRYKPALNVTSNECIVPSDSPPTAAPLLSIPPSPTTNNTPTIIVGSVPQGETYRLEIDETNTFADPAYAVSLNPEQLTHAIASPLPEGLVYIRVRAVKNSNPEPTRYGPWSAVKTLFIDTTAPDTPTPLLPSSSPALTTYTPTLKWQAVSGAVAYLVVLSQSDPTLETPISVAVPAWTVNRTLTTGVYYWRVRSRDALGNLSAWSSLSTFTINSPSNAAPRPNVYISSPTVRWTLVNGAVGYHVQVAADKAFTAAKIQYNNESIVGANSVTITALPNGAYYYRVRAKLSTGWGAWSAPTPLVINQ